MERNAKKTLQRLAPRIKPILGQVDSHAQAIFWQRLDDIFPEAFVLLLELYGTQYDFFYHLETILSAIAQAYVERSADLHALDAQREANPLWFQSEQMIGGVCYVDLFATDLAGVRQKLPYFKDLGLTYLHLMPLFESPEFNDGGYAVSSYRTIDPALGSMADLTQLAAELRANNMSLALDFVFNHTSDEHDWAKKALAGDEEYQDYYLMFPDRTLPDQYEAHLRDIFPTRAPGSFSYRPEIERWVWTTFYPFQWDLQYANPAVFVAMLQEMLFLANIGTEILRLDAVPFVWKELGTPCENLPQAHTLIQAYNALLRIVAPAMLFKSEAIVHPDDVAKYMGEGPKAGYECPISYNPTLMALLWESLATREVRLLKYAMQRRLALPANCAWVNYVRVHDDIGWSFADEDALALWIKPFDHRQFLNSFYTNQFPGSFAQGLLFNFNPMTKDGRINGTCASLAGLELAIQTQDEREITLSLRRILLLYSIVLSIGGIPLIYIGDEVATLNDYSYQQQPIKADDGRWVHRPKFDWQQAEKRHKAHTVTGQIFQNLTRLIHIRKNHAHFAGNYTQVIDSGNPHIFAYIHRHEQQAVLVLNNFSEHAQDVYLTRFQGDDLNPGYDLVKDEPIDLSHPYLLPPYQFLWLI